MIGLSDRHDFPRRLDSERERRHVDEQQIFGGVAAVALEDAGLNSGAVRDGPERKNKITKETAGQPPFASQRQLRAPVKRMAEPAGVIQQAL